MPYVSDLPEDNSVNVEGEIKITFSFKTIFPKEFTYDEIIKYIRENPYEFADKIKEVNNIDVQATL